MSIRKDFFDPVEVKTQLENEDLYTERLDQNRRVCLHSVSVTNKIHRTKQLTIAIGPLESHPKMVRYFGTFTDIDAGYTSTFKFPPNTTIESNLAVYAIFKGIENEDGKTTSLVLNVYGEYV